jgi:Ca-activated chloride channel homolog
MQDHPVKPWLSRQRCAGSINDVRPRGGRGTLESSVKGLLTSILVGICSIALFAVAPSPRQQSPIRSGARTVAVYATATDAKGRLVSDLPRDAFEIYDNGEPQTITVFSNDIQPITVVMMLDRSGSMRAHFTLLEAAGEAFVRRLRPLDKARIGSFAWRVDVDPEDFTSDQKELARILRMDLQTDGPTPLWNAVNVAITSLLTQHGRRVVLVFTDGDDNPANGRSDNVSLADVMARAQRENVMVYAVGLASSLPPRTGRFAAMRTQGPDPGLPMLASETGGGYFELTRAEDLASTFARVADELHRQYALGFEPTTLDDRVHTLEVKVRTPGARVRARKSYVASRDFPLVAAEGVKRPYQLPDARICTRGGRRIQTGMSSGRRRAR